MKGNQKFIAGLIVGAAAAGVAALFLQSEKGKQLIDKVKDAAANAQDDLSDLFKKGKQCADEQSDQAQEVSSL